MVDLLISCWTLGRPLWLSGWSVGRGEQRSQVQVLVGVGIFSSRLAHGFPFFSSIIIIIIIIITIYLLESSGRH